MRFGGVPVEASLAGPRDPAKPIEDWRSPRGIVKVDGYRGWLPDPAATFKVKARFQSGGESMFRRLRFVVAKKASRFPPCPDPGCPQASPPVSLVIDHTLEQAGKIPPGEYSLRYRCMDDLGAESAWAYDHSLVVTGILAPSVMPTDDFPA
jgi:hypothetical protein